MTRDNFAELLTPGHKKVFFNSYNEVPEQYSKVFTMGSQMTTKTETEIHEGAFGLWQENTEGNTINESQMHEGNKVTWVARRFDNGYSLTWELVSDQMYQIFQGTSKVVTEGQGKGGSAKALGTGLRSTIEKDAADVLNNGFTVNGYDSTTLFSDSHPLADSASNGDNLTTGALSPTTLKNACILMRGTVDEANVIIMCVPKKLIVPPELEYTAKDIIKSTNNAYELSNTVNNAPNLEIVVLDYLTSATAWFAQAGNLENLVFKWREKPFFGTQPIPKTVDTFCYGFARWDNGYSNWRGIVGSTGL